MALPKSKVLLLSLLGTCGASSVSASVTSTQVQSSLEANAFSVYPGYTGDLAVSGNVQVGEDGIGTQVLSFHVEGADPQCNGTADIAGVANACGIHVHAGLSCDDAGDHYYNSNSVTEDPWKPVRYTVDGNGSASGQNVHVVTGWSLADVDGRTMVVHDITGARVACALLQGTQIAGMPLFVESFSKYPGYTGSLSIAGSVAVEQIGTGAEASQVLAFSLTGVDPACSVADSSGARRLRGAASGSVPNACGIHVHEGSNCSDADTVGGHFYNSAIIAEDPWTTITYNSPDGVATGITESVVTGVTSSQVLGRTLVVHDSAGVRIACGKIVQKMASSQLPLETSAFSTYPGYTGSLAVSGSVQVGETVAGTQILSFMLEGADPQCNSTADIAGVANACGIHVHAGLSCEDAGGHYYDNASVTEDPWKSVRYTTVDGNGTASDQNVQVITGWSLADVDGRTMVVHDVTGARVACALLHTGIQGSPLRVEAFSKYPGYTGSLAVAGNMSVQQVGTGAEASQVLAFSLTGADPTCGTADTTGVANACGIHVHQGTDCTDADTVGGHYFAADLDSDPWQSVMYTALGGLTAGVNIKVKTGLTNQDIVGHTMVVHDATGARIACGQIVDETQVAAVALHSGASLPAFGSFLASALLLVSL